MALDLKGLKEFDKELDQRGGGGLFFYQKDLTEDGVDFRLAPPNANLNGRYYIEVIKWWINGKSYSSPETFGKPCPIQAELDRNKGTKDKDLLALINNDDKIRKASEFWMVGFVLKPLNDKYTDFKVVEDKAKILSCTTQLMKDINRAVTSRQASKIDSEDGITDRVLGVNLLLSKKGSGMKTEYKGALGDAFEMDEKYYAELPDLLATVKKSIKSDAYLDSVIGNYLYGDPIIEDEKEEEKDEPKTARRPAAEKEEPAERSGRGKAAEETTTRSSRAAKEEAPATEGRSVRRSLLNDLDD